MRISHDNYHRHIFKTNLGGPSIVPSNYLKVEMGGRGWQSRRTLSSWIQLDNISAQMTKENDQKTGRTTSTAKGGEEATLKKVGKVKTQFGMK